MPDADLLDSPIAEAEFLAVDTETNGQPQERCEMTEVGAVLVGGGELHDRWSSLVGVSEPLGRGIQRFTGITQQMVDAAPPPSRRAAGARRAAAGSSARRAQRALRRGVLRQAFERAELDWPDPPVLCTVALARRLAPLQRRRGLASLADALGIEVEPDAPRAARRGDLRARALRAAAAAVRERAHDRRGARWSARAAQAAAPQAGRGQAPARRAPRPQLAPQGPGRLHLPRRRRPSAVRRQVGRACARGRGRTSRRRRPGPGRPSTSTTSRPSPSSARSCSRTG